MNGTLLGKTLNNQYRVVAMLAQGSMSVLYLAEHVNSKQKAALKVLNKEYTRDEACVGRFRQEARLAGALVHPNLAQIYELDQTDEGHLFIVMEHIAGKGLKELIRQGNLDTLRVVRLSIQIADGLAAAHKGGIVHRDVKPGNIMIAQGDRVKVINFGIARLLEAGALTRLTGAGMISGTPAYMAPEQIENGNIDERTDVYALGVVLYEMLTGVVPFRAPTAAAVQTKHLRENPIPVRDLHPHIPTPLEQIVTQALEKHPDRRWAKMADIAEALSKVEADSPKEVSAAPSMATQVLTAVNLPSALQETISAPIFNEPRFDQADEKGDFVTAVQVPRSQLQEVAFDRGQESQSLDQTMAVQSTMVATMALTRPMEAIKQGKIRWQWLGLGLGGTLLVLGGLSAWFGMFREVHAPDSTEQTTSASETSGPKRSPEMQIVSVAITPNQTTLAPRQRAGIRLRVEYVGGAREEIKDQTNVQWTSSDPSVLVTNPSGEIEAKGTGKAEVTARYKGVEAPSVTILVSQPAQLVSVPPESNLLSLAIKSSRTEIAPKNRLSLHLMGKYSDGREKEMSKEVRWKSSDTKIATVNSRGEVLGQKEGRVNILARYANVTSKPLNLVVRSGMRSLATQSVKNLGSAKIAEINDRIRAARSDRDRGAYAEALAELEKASKADPNSNDVQTEIHITKRACNAERTLGRSDLKC
jgi:serine/threonine protein kinase